METTHEKLRFRSQLLEKTSVLKSSKVRDLKPQFRSQLLEKTRVLNHALLARLKSQFLPSATATVATDSGITLTHVKTEGVIPPSLLKIQEVDYFLNQLKIQPIDTQPLITSQNSNSDFLTEFNKISYLTPPKNRERDYLVTEPKIQLSDVGKSHLTNNSKVYIRGNSKSADSSQLEKINQLSFFDSFNCVDKVAVTGNNLKQERQNLFKSVQHHTIVDVFLCLSFANCLFTGELRLALALVRLWWGGDGNKPFIRQIPSAVLLRFSNLPTALHLGQITKTSLPVRKV